MTDSLPKLPLLEINTPCTESWDEMSGDVQSRHCFHCQKSVYNFAEMATDEVREVLHSGESVCAQIRRLNDGSIVTRDTWQPQLSNRRGLLQRLCSATLAILTTAMMTGCGQDRAANIQSPPEPVEQLPEVLMGDICVVEMGEVEADPGDTAQPK